MSFPIYDNVGMMVDEARKEAAKVEIAKLIAEFEKNRDYYDKTDEANIETKLIEPMFAALGWTKDDFEKREKVKRRDRRGITDYTFKLRGKSVFVLEAKKVKVEVEWDEVTWKQAISYTFSKKVSFSVLTNFKNLLIFCTDDEKAMRPFRQLKYTEYLTSRFDDLWLLSKDSFEQNLILERAADEGRMKKRRTIDDELLEGLLSSRKKIVESIEQNYGGKYTTLEKDDIAQRIFGRLIFMRKCEDKQINFDKDGKEIEMLKEVTALPHNEAYPKLKKIFTKYNDVFDSGLFMKEADSDADRIEIDGKVIKELVNSTYESKDGNYVYNFEWIDADILGNIYEQYLGHILKETSKQTRIKESHAHRKEQGIYYTPTDIVKYIVDNTLGEILKEKKPEEIRKLRVLDPACGSGSFLIKAFDVLEDYYEKNMGGQSKFHSSGDFYSIKEQVLTNNIFGVDLDHKAVEIAQLNLLLKLAEKGHKLPLLEKNIQNGNSLIDDEAIAGNKAFRWKEKFPKIMNEDGFDVVIGNPPYVRNDTLEKQEKNYYMKKYASAKGKFDLYLVFIEKAISLLKNNGLLGFIVPSKFMATDYGFKLRQHILEKCQILQLVDVSQLPVFEGVATYPCILILQKTSKKNKASHKIKIYTGVHSTEDIILGKGKHHTIDQRKFEENQKNVFTLSTDEVMGKITSDTQPLSELCEVKAGIHNGNIRDKLIKKEKESEFYKKLLVGGDVERYSKKWSGLYVNYNNKIIDKKSGEYCSLREERIFTAGEKLLVRDIGKRLPATYDNKQFYCMDTIYIILLKNKLKKEVGLKYILGILNSNLLDFYFRMMFGTVHVGSNYQRYKKQFLVNLPIKVCTLSAQRPLINLVDKILSLHEQLNELGDKNTPETVRLKEEIQKADHEIDELVYKLYGITEEEKKIIEESLK